MSREIPAFLSSFLEGYLAAPKSLPSPEARADITAKLTELVKALEKHPLWKPRSQNAGLFHVWDFVNRSRYIMTELDNIREGKPVEHPAQIPPNRDATSPEHSAVLSYQDVCTRISTVDDMIQNPRELTMLGMNQVDFGENVRELSRALRQAIRGNTGPSSK